MRGCGRTALESTWTAPAPYHLVYYGDSTSAAAGWPAKFRGLHYGKQDGIATGGRQLWDDYTTDNTMATLANSLLAFVGADEHAEFHLLIGVNDFWQHNWANAAAYGAAFAALVALIRAGRPRATDRIWMHTILNSYEGEATANADGQTKADYRAAAAGAIAGVVGAYLIDGVTEDAIPRLLMDTVAPNGAIHPTDPDGWATMAAYIRSRLGA